MCLPLLLSAVTEMLVNVLSLKDDDLVDEGDDKIKPGSGTHSSMLDNVLFPCSHCTVTSCTAIACLYYCIVSLSLSLSHCASWCGLSLCLMVWSHRGG